ncbi:hypothetical protein [Vitiosangium sp. GDMCC 1.1324]|uniref:hypothetical protein n=1 Tax=Vitiosangium sp. (strain GDMCC 1.1324) TaxID=2138576 RepID=UPI000D3DC0BA|nr:hypothetical protein [Vitiosangium sp. GDMCC 1.1324]PTL81347.1 hypothetical protein DAT35_24870 [Vitiosangium sp. GDMCC 1.1324]
MRWRRVFAFTLLMAVGTACPETWREGGTIDRAMAKDIEEELHRHNCDLSKEEWLRRCKVPADWADRKCPHQCQFRSAE